MQKENESIITDRLTGNVGIRIIEDIASKKLYLTLERPDGLYVAEPININFRKINPEEGNPSPTITLHHHFADHLLKTIVEQLKQDGITTDTETKAEAKLEVTEKWLEDMRKLVFHDK